MSSRRAPRIPEPVPGGRGRQGQAAWLPSSQTLGPPQGDLAVTGLNCRVDVSFQVTPYSDHALHPAPNWKSEVSDLPSRVKTRGGGGGQLPAPLCSPRPHSPTLTLSFTPTPTPVDLVSVKARQRCGRFGEVGRYTGVGGWRKLGFPRASTQSLVGLCSQEGSGWRIDPRRPRGLGAPKAVGVGVSGGSHTTFPGGLPRPMTLPPPRAPGSSAPGTPPSAQVTDRLSPRPCPLLLAC